MKNPAEGANIKCSDLCTPTRPYRLAKLGTSLRVRGKLTLRENATKFYMSKNKKGNDSYKRKNRERKPSPNMGKVSTVRLTKGASVSKNKRTEISVSKNKKY